MLLFGGMLGLLLTACAIYAIVANPTTLPEPTAIALPQSRYEMRVGDQVTLRIDVQPLRATTVGRNEWSSDNPQVATAYPGGIVIAKREGRALVTVKRGDLIDSCTVIVSR